MTRPAENNRNLKKSQNTTTLVQSETKAQKRARDRREPDGNENETIN